MLFSQPYGITNIAREICIPISLWLSKRAIGINLSKTLIRDNVAHFLSYLKFHKIKRNSEEVIKLHLANPGDEIIGFDWASDGRCVGRRENR